MNRSLTNVIFGGIAPTQVSEGESDYSRPRLMSDSTKGMSVTRTNVEEVVEMLGNAESVIVVPGYGQPHAVQAIRNARGLCADRYRYGRR